MCVVLARARAVVLERARAEGVQNPETLSTETLVSERSLTFRDGRDVL